MDAGPRRRRATPRESSRELIEAREQLAATSEILTLISRSRFELQPVLDGIISRAARLCRAEWGLIFRVAGDGSLHALASEGRKEFLRFVTERPLEPDRGTVTGRTALEGRLVHVHDVLDDPEYRFFEGQQEGGYRTVLGVPLLREDAVIGVIILLRNTVRPFAQTEIDLVTTFADQAAIAIENVRLFTDLERRNRELTEALEQQSATSEILRIISRTPTTVQPVFDTIARSAARLCSAVLCHVFRYDGELVHFVAHHYEEMPAEAERAITAALDHFPQPPDRRSAAGRAISSGAVEHIADIRRDPDYALAQVGDLLGFSSIVAVPMLRDGEPIGAITVMRATPGRFPDGQVELLETFADQAVIAVENVRLFNALEERNRDLNEALQQQTATSEVLGVIASSPNDLAPVLAAVAENATELCDAYDAVVFLREGDVLRVAAHRGPIPVDFDGWPVNRHWVSGRTVLTRAPIHVHDLSAEADEYPEGCAMALKLGHRTILGVPLLRQGEAIGCLVIRRLEVKPFLDKQIALLQVFADQAVIAVQNVRLFSELEARNRELSEALQQQTATSDVLRVISTSLTDAMPVFDTIVRSAVTLCNGQFANVFRFDGELLHFVTSDNITSGYIDLLRQKYPMRPDTSQVAGRVVLQGDVVRLEDVLRDPEYDQRFPSIRSWRRMLGVPMMRHGEVIGVIVVGWPDPGPIPRRQEELLRTFADQAVIAVENVRLFHEVQARTRELSRSVEELRALGEVGQAVNSTLDIETVLSTIVAKAVQLSGTDAGAIYVFREATRDFRLRATYGTDEGTVAAIRGHRIGLGGTAVGEAAQRRAPLQVPDVREAAGDLVLDAVVRAGYRAVLVIPMFGRDSIVGSLVVRRKEPGAFAEATIELLQTFAAQSVLAIQNARLFREIEEKGQQLEIASRHKSQFLANMSHELRTPLNAILGYTELILDGIYGEAPETMQGVLERVQSNGRHLLGLINDVLDLSKIEAGQLTLSLADYSLADVVQSVRTALEPLAAEKDLRLLVDLPPDLPVARGDERRIAQVLMNLVGNAIKFTDAGEVAITAGTRDGRFTVSVRDTGPGIAAEDQALIFEEFRQADDSSTRRKGGSGLGLTISRRIAEMHGGRITVDSVPGRGSVFTLELPVTAEPQDTRS